MFEITVVENGVKFDGGEELGFIPGQSATIVLYQILDNNEELCKRLLREEDGLTVIFPQKREVLPATLFRSLLRKFYDDQHGVTIQHMLGDTSVSTYGIPTGVEYCDTEWCLVMFDLGALSTIRIPFSDIEAW